MGTLRWYVRDRATGVYRGEGAATNDDRTAAAMLSELRAVSPADVEIIDAATSPRPPDPPDPPDPLKPKRQRLGALRTKGWTALTLVEKDEARALAFDLGEPSPPAA